MGEFHARNRVAPVFVSAHEWVGAQLKLKLEGDEIPRRAELWRRSRGQRNLEMDVRTPDSNAYERKYVFISLTLRSFN